MKKYVILFILVLGVGIYIYFWYQENNNLRLEAQSVITEAKQYEIVKQKIIEERQRCEGFIAQKEGDFGSFEYCQRLIQWVNILIPKVI